MIERQKPVLTDPLTAGELEALQLAADGLTNVEIAASLYMAPTTVMHRFSMIFQKMGMENTKSGSGRCKAVADAFRLGLIE